VATPLLTESPVANLREILWNLETKKRHLGKWIEDLFLNSKSVNF